MLRTLRSRRRPRYGAQVCAVIAALLLLLSVSLLHTRLSQPHQLLDRHKPPLDDAVFVDSDEGNLNENEDKIDELDNVDDEQENDTVEDGAQDQHQRKVSSSGYYFDHVTGSVRRASNKKSIDEWDFDHVGFNVFSVESSVDDSFRGVFGSDDVPVDDEVRRKMSEVIGIEDALLLKIGKRVSPLRDTWGQWFDKKSEFLRRDRMFKSHLEVLNPMNNPLLQDPDGVGFSGLTRGDKVVQKWLLDEFKRTPFIGEKPLRVVQRNGDGKSEIKRAERRTLKDNASNGTDSSRVDDDKENLSLVVNGNLVNKSNGNASNESYTDKVNESDVDLSKESNKNDKSKVDA